MYNLEELNEVQRRAVVDTEGAVLVTAGAGSGKTRLLTHRIAHLIKDLHVPPYNILAITFTNKAADEMRNRLEYMLGDIDGIWVFTFHAMCVRILRRFIDLIGFNKDFTIYGEAESKAVVKRYCKDRDQTDETAKLILSEISNAKNKGISPQDYAKVHSFSQYGDVVGEAFIYYQQVLKANNALDYDDLLLQTLYLLKTSDIARAFFADKFRYIHIDEFQDTNLVQYEIAKLLASVHGNIFAVGDEDQCIYTWRGASIANIFDFKRDFDCKVYKLEQNYRSTAKILETANKIIKINTQRLDKKLYTENGEGDPVVCYCAQSEGFEADYVVRKIYELVCDGEYDYSDCAVLMRVNALTRSFEERFLQYGIPHKVYGGFKFYDRKEVKDVLAYARISVNPADDEAIYRIINFPRRGIGETSVEKIRAYCAESGKSAFDVITNVDFAPFPSALKSKLTEFARTLTDLTAAAAGPVTDYFKFLLYGVLNIDRLFDGDDESGARLENINELVNSVRDFVRNNKGAGLSDYLQTASLYSDTDDIQTDNAVTLATVHSAKGLEFPVVFVVGLEDGVFPSIRVGENNSDRMEEERRLMYVAVTRAMKKLYLTYCKSRFMYGETKYPAVSRFLVECGLAARPYVGADAYTNMPSFRGGYGGMSARETSARETSSVDGAPLGGQKFTATYKSGFGKPAEPKPSARGDVSEFVVGATVMHKRLGKGKILSVENLGNNLYAKIDFERGGVMQLAVGFAPLTVIKE